jgi:hypothetical protein
MPYIPGIIECYEKLFAIISMEKGFITLDDFINSLIIQTKEHAKSGKQRFIREIFLDHKIMTVKQVAEVCDFIFQNSSTISTVNIDYLTSTLKNLCPKYLRLTKKIVNDVDWKKKNKEA